MSKPAVQLFGRAGMPKAWCAEARDGLWCAAADTWTPDSVTASIPTLCGRHIVLPHGVAQRAPTCPECRAEMGGGGDGQQ